jgi:hypothetical protein
MNSHITGRFRARLAALPKAIQHDARQAYRQFQQDPDHPGLSFTPVIAKDGEPYWSVRIGLHYRALGIMENGEIYWFWIGTHAEYDKLLAEIQSLPIVPQTMCYFLG